MFSCSTGAPGLMASSTFVTAGSASYSTSIRSSASSAAWGLDAATAATGCPLWSALSSASTAVDRYRRLITRSSPTSISLSSVHGKSACVTTANTPGWAAARSVSIDLIRACACGLRSIFPCSSPGSWMSAPYTARPVTLSVPSCLTGRVPTTLNLLSTLPSVTVAMAFTSLSPGP